MTKPLGDKAAQDAVEGRAREAGDDARPDAGKMPSAGPHTDPGLVNPDATPGSGYLPSPGKDDEAEAPGG